jgi:hypothetical protein
MAAQIRFFDSPVMFIYLEEKAPKKIIQKTLKFGQSPSKVSVYQWHSVAQKPTLKIKL